MGTQAGWGTFFGKIAQQFQSPEQRRRNEIDRLEKRQKQIESQKDNSRALEYGLNADRLHVLYEQAKNT